MNVKRFDPIAGYSSGDYFGEMKESANGDWVSFDAYEALRAKLQAEREAHDRDGVALVKETRRLDFLLLNLPSDAIRYVLGDFDDTSDGAAFRTAIDAELAKA